MSLRCATLRTAPATAAAARVKQHTCRTERSCPACAAVSFQHVTLQHAFPQPPSHSFNRMLVLGSSCGDLEPVHSCLYRDTCCRIPTGQQMVHFFSFLGAGVLFLFFAFFIGLPTLLLSPSKFALFFTIGCCLVLSAFAALKGWRAQMQHMMARERLPFSAGGLNSLQAAVSMLWLMP